MKINTKIWKFEPSESIYEHGKFIVGMAGSVNEMMDIVDFFSHPTAYKTPPRLRDSQGMVLTESGEIFYFSNPVKWMLIKEKYHAIGSGCLTALGALAVGASPKDAVKAAMNVDPLTGMGTRVLHF